MPRRARLALADMAWHIIRRGNNPSACFCTAEDYRNYLESLRDQVREHGCQVHVYVLMIKHLCQCYVQYINRTYRPSGTLWETRFRSCLVQDERYVPACCRYIELNPVGPDMVAHPADYPWSRSRINSDQ